MSVVVYKYPIEIGQNVLQLPKEHTILKVGSQAIGGAPRDIVCEQLVLWALVTPSKSDLEPRLIHVVATGQAMDCNLGLEYIDTVIMGNGTVWHVFAAKRKAE